ncbi:hypothetical protein [Rhizobium beringeri]|uniref:hypothetical protein n=1 Tax=Rhizobium beringeri TaxID=3019934 RepID=UPI003B591225
MTFKAFDAILQPDPRFEGLHMVESGVPGSRQMRPQDHHSSLSRIKLSGIAPIDVHNAIDRARNTMIYVFFDYDLFVVGEVQAFGSFELALKHRINGHGGISRGTLRNLVERGRKLGLLPREIVDGRMLVDPLNALIELRNGLSHGTSDIHTPGMALPVLEMCVHWIDHVYPPPA